MNKIKPKTIIWKEGKYFVSQCLDINIASFGKTKKQALSNLQEAIDLYLEEKDFKKN